MYNKSSVHEKKQNKYVILGVHKKSQNTDNV